MSLDHTTSGSDVCCTAPYSTWQCVLPPGKVKPCKRSICLVSSLQCPSGQHHHQHRLVLAHFCVQQAILQTMRENQGPMSQCSESVILYPIVCLCVPLVYTKQQCRPSKSEYDKGVWEECRYVEISYRTVPMCSARTQTLTKPDPNPTVTLTDDV